MQNRIRRNQSIGNAVVRDTFATEFKLDGEEGKIPNDYNDEDLIKAICDLSNSIKDLAMAAANQKPPIIINLIANNDDDLQKFATIFAQGIK